MIDPIFFRVLQKICPQLDDIGVKWALTGSLNLALQGLPVEVKDIDILTDRAGAFMIENRFREFVVRDVAFTSGERIRSYFGALNIDGVKVEIMGDVQLKNKDGSWENPVDIERNRRTLKIEGIQIPVMSLEREYQAYVTLKRHKKAEMIRKYLNALPK